jgi:hypothetical protein
VAGTGGVIFSPRGNTRLTYSWSLVNKNKNKQRHMLFFKDCFLAQQHGLDSISILGDSKVVINHVGKKTFPLDMKLREIFIRIHKELE